MDRLQKVAYLANVLSIAAADGRLAPEEDMALRAIIRELRADESIVRQAQGVVSRGKYSPMLAGGRRDRMKNVEDMVLVAFADGKLEDVERGPIEKLTSALDLAQADMDLLVKRARGRLVRLQRRERSHRPPPIPAGSSPRKQEPRSGPSHVFDSPGPAAAAQPARAEQAPAQAPAQASVPGAAPATPVPSPAKAATPAAPVPASARAERLETPGTEQTGPPRPVEEKSVPVSPAQQKPGYTPPAEGIAVAFRCAPSALPPAARTALAAAAESGTFAVGRAVWHFAQWPQARRREAGHMALAIAGLSTKRVYLDGKERAWNELFGFCACARDRARAAAPAAYCYGARSRAFNVWGCRMLNMPWTHDAEWFACGLFLSEESFALDKTAIRARLEQASDAARMCPHLSHEHLDAAVDELPEQVTAWYRWQFRETAPGSPGAEKRTVRRYIHGCSVTMDIVVNGISPVMPDEGYDLIRRAARRAGRPVPALEDEG